jgi:hypothetical protein
MILKLLAVTLAVFILNVPFGYWRSNVKKFSLQWFVAIHSPVPFIVLLRVWSGIGFAWYTYVFLVGAFFLGQRYGAGVYKRNMLRLDELTSCFFADIKRLHQQCC